MVSVQPSTLRQNMKSGSGVAISVMPGAFRDEVLLAITRLGLPVAHDQRDPGDWPGLVSALERSGADILLFDMRSMSETQMAGAFADLKRRLPGVRIVALNPNDSSQAILAAMRSGATEFVNSPVADMLGSALERIATIETLTAAPEQRRGKVIGFVSAKGGCGATTIACHVAAELRRQTKQEVLLADFDLRCGVVGFLLKVASQYSLFDAADNLGRLDNNLWTALLATSKGGISVLPSPVRASHPDLGREEVQQVISFMRTQHDWIVLDLGRGPDPLSLAAMEEVDDLVVVSTLDVAALHMAKVVIRSLPSLEVRTRCHLILNRTQKAIEVSRDEVEKIFGQRLFAAIPDDYAALYTAYASGSLLSPDAKLSKYFAAIAAQFAGVQEKKPKKFSFFG